MSQLMRVDVGGECAPPHCLVRIWSDTAYNTWDVRPNISLGTNMEIVGRRWEKGETERDLTTLDQNWQDAYTHTSVSTSHMLPSPHQMQSSWKVSWVCVLRKRFGDHLPSNGTTTLAILPQPDPSGFSVSILSIPPQFSIQQPEWSLQKANYMILLPYINPLATYTTWRETQAIDVACRCFLDMTGALSPLLSVPSCWLPMCVETAESAPISGSLSLLYPLPGHLFLKV